MTAVERSYASIAELEAEFRDQLTHGRIFLSNVTLPQREQCKLTLKHPVRGHTFELQAEVVWVVPNGAGLAFAAFDAEALAAFVHAPGPAEAHHEERTGQDRIRHLNARERDDTARHGNMTDRVALERAFGGLVWEALLSNPQLTIPEVARIAKHGTLPRPLVQTIVANSSWLASAEVQRALLSNPRCGGAHLERVLRAMRPADVVALTQQCPYRPEVKAAALHVAKKA